MESQTIAFLLGAGALGGFVNAIAGGATLITFPAMLAAGLPPILANASNAVALAPGYLAAALADWAARPAFDRRFAVWLAAAPVGGAAGAVALLLTPPVVFALLVPALVGSATILFAFAKPLQARLAARFGGEDAPGLRAGLLAPACLYGGYFGAGLGVILLATISITGREALRFANTLKNLLSSAVSLIAVTIFVVSGAVSWPETLAMMAGAVLGGVAGGRLVRVLPARVVFWFVVALGGAMTAIYAARYWL